MPRQRRLYPFILLVAFLLFWSTSRTYAQGNDALAGVRVDVEPFLQGLFKPGTWLPLRVRLKNAGPDVTVRVMASFRRRGGDVETFVRQVELPAGVRKETVLYVRPNRFSREFVVLVEGNGIRVEQSVRVRALEASTLVVGVASGNPNALEAFALLNRIGTRDVEVVSVEFLHLPTYAAAWNALDVLVLADADTSRFTPEQQRALTLWVARGGTLVLGGGSAPAARRVLAGLPDLLRPVNVTGDASIEDLSALSEWTGVPVRVSGPFLVARAAPAEETTTEVVQQGLPLLVSRPLHQGRVVWMALDPTRTPFDAWAGADDFWNQVLAGEALLTPLAFGEPALENREAQMGWALNNLPSMSLPSLRLLVPLFLAYILAVGPLNYFLLRRRRRLEWAWGTIPAITLIFSVATFAVGWRVRGRDLLVHQISVVEAYPDAGLALRRSYMSLFSPTRRAYRLELPNAPLLSLLATSVDVFGPPFEPLPSEEQSVSFYQGGVSSVENFRTNQWTPRYLVAEYRPTDLIPLTADLTLEGERVRGTVRNLNPLPVRDAALIMGGKVHRVGDILPLAEREVEFTFSERTGMMRQPISVQLFPYEGGTDRDRERKRQVVQAILEMPALRPRSTVMLVGWVEDAVPSLRVEGATYQGNRLDFLVVSLSPQVRGGIPPVLWPVRVNAGEDAFCFGGVFGLSPLFENVEMSFRLPPSIAPEQVTHLLLSAQQDGGWVDTPDVAVWDWNQEAWVSVEEVVWGVNEIPSNGKAFVAPDGEVRLRIGRPSGGGGCLYFFLGARTGEEP